MSKKITQLTAATAGEISDDDLLAVVENASGATKKVTRVNLLDDAVATASLQDDAVTTAKVNDGAITGAKLDTDAIIQDYDTRDTNVATSSTSAVQISGLSNTITVESGKKVRIRFFGPSVVNTTKASVYISIWNGTVGSGTQLQESRHVLETSTSAMPAICEAFVTGLSGSQTFNAAIRVSGGTGTVAGASTAPMILTTEQF